MNNKRTFYKISYENNYVSIEFLEDEMHEIYGRLANIYIAKNDYSIRKLSNVFIKLDEEILLKYSTDYEIYLRNVAKILLDEDRTDRIMLKRNGNFGELRYDSINKEVNKFSYDGDGEDTKEYRKEKNIELKDEKIDLVKNKKVYKILDNVIKSSIDIIDNKIYIGYVPFRKYIQELNQKKRIQVSKKDIKWYKGLHEPIVPLELFEFCQSIREKNIKSRAVYGDYKPYLLFSSMIYCECGDKMYQQKRNRSYKDNTKYAYYSYSCKNRKHKKSFSAKIMDKTIKEMILNSKELEDLNNYNSNDIEKNEKKLLKLENNLKVLENERERIINLFQKSYISEDELENRFKDLNARIKIAKEKKLEFEKSLNIPKNNDIKLLEKLKFIIENYDEEDVIETRKILKMIIKEIRVISFYPLKISILFY